jgi:DnaJ-domain-containing protein 1
MERTIALQLLNVAILALILGNGIAFQAPVHFGSIRTVSPAASHDNNNHWQLRQEPALSASARGMGGGMATKKKAKKGKSASENAPFNVNASLMRLEKRYDELSLADAKRLQQDEDSPDDLVTTEYIVTARVLSKSQKSSVPDWVPIAQLCMARTMADAHASEGASDPAINAAVSLYCRELSLAAAFGAPVFQSVARNEMEYAVENMDSFHKHVYEVVINGKNEDAKNENVMTKVDARTVLKLEEESVDKSVLKQAYRKLSFALHPDRFVGSDKTEEEIKAASAEFGRVKLAYETLSSGVRDEGKSWYESLGGRARTDFAGPLSLLSLAGAQSTIDAMGVQSALIQLDPKMVAQFLVRARRP